MGAETVKDLYSHGSFDETDTATRTPARAEGRLRDERSFVDGREKWTFHSESA